MQERGAATDYADLPVGIKVQTMMQTGNYRQWPATKTMRERVSSSHNQTIIGIPAST
jgi:hypothetical protein